MYNNLSLQGVFGSSSGSSISIEPTTTSSRLLSSSASSEIVAANSDSISSRRTGAPTVTVNAKLVSSVKEMPFYINKLKAMEQRKLNKKNIMRNNFGSTLSHLSTLCFPKNKPF